MRRSLVTVATVALVAAGAAVLLYMPRVSCDNLPEFHVLVGGAAPAPGQVSGAGTFCGALGDGKAITSLDPVRVHPGAEAAVLYDSRVRWDRLTYTVRQGEKVVAQGRLRGRASTFPLPEAPGTYEVAVTYQWDGWLSGDHARGAEYFRIQVGPAD